MHANLQSSRRAARQGQALVEFVVGLVAVLALLAGLLQLASLGTAWIEAHAEARTAAARRAILDAAPGGAVPRYLRDWEPGPDRRRHTRDDVALTGNPVPFQSVVVGAAVSGPHHREILERVPRDRITALYDGPAPASLFGLVSGTGTRDVPTLPAVRSLLYRADRIALQETVWMTRTGGIY